MKTNICELALKGAEETKHGNGQYVLLDDNMRVKEACYLGLVAIGAGEVEDFTPPYESDEEAKEQYPEALEDHVNAFIISILLEHLEHRYVTYCPLAQCDLHHKMNQISLIIHLNDNHLFTVEQINATLELLGWC